MKLTINTSFQANASSQSLLILVDSEHVQNTADSYQINDLDKTIEAVQFKAGLNETLTLIGTVKACGNTTLVGIGKAEELQPAKLAKIAQTIIKASQKKFQQISIDISTLPQELHYLFALSLTQASYAFDEYKSKKNEFALQQVNFIATQSVLTEQQLQLISAIQNGQNYTRDLGNRPGNICFPEYLAEQALALEAEFPDLLKVTVLDEQQMADLGMGAFLAVSKGSDRPGRIITLEYQANRSEAPVVLVGKGVTFDTGGISLKPGAGMDEMKYDMCGAASLLGTFKTLGETQPKINVIGLIATCENMPAGNASKPGDVVTTMAGLTVEILNTDAEGRLILCDALTYAERYKPAAVVNMATLTGACIVALGHHHSGLFANDDVLANDLQAAGQTQRDTAWRMPLDDAYQEQLKSNFADMANIGGMPAGSVTAACFLSRFTKSYPWAHLDIAGTAWKSGAAKGATGRPVALLSQFIFNRAAKK